MLSDSCSERLTAVRHCNGADVWILVAVPSLDQFRAFKVDGNGVSQNPVISPIGAWPNNTIVNQGCMKFSPNGKKLGLIEWMTSPYQYKMFDFDNSTGVVSNPFFFGPNFPTYAYGCEFSPDGTKFYSSSEHFVVQWDLCAGSNSAIAASQITVGTHPNPPNGNMFFGSLQLASDGKIYCVQSNLVNLGVINNPNLSGTACNFSSNGPNLLPYGTGWGLPNFITSYFKEVPKITYSLTSSGCQSMSFNSPPLSNISPTCIAASSSYTSCKWIFGDPNSGTANISTVANPLHNFTSQGIYKVTLILYTNCSADTVRQNVSVGCTEIISNFPENGVRLFPNPANEKIFIETDVETEVTIFDYNGRSVFKEIIGAGLSDIRIGELKPGLYVMSASNGKNNWRRKFVKIE